MTTNSRQASKEESALRHFGDAADECLDAVINEQVLHALGRPPDMVGVQIRKVWQGHYRVNVLLGRDAASVHVGHSYYLTVSDDGGILSARPSIDRVY